MKIKTPSTRQPDGTCISQCLDKNKPLEGEWSPSLGLIDFRVGSVHFNSLWKSDL